MPSPRALFLLFVLVMFAPAGPAGAVPYAPVQNITTQNAYDWEFFTIDGEGYLAVTTYFSLSYNDSCRVYRWDGTAFVQEQAFPTSGSQHAESFTIGGDTYLAVANAYDGVTGNIESKIYRWSGASFDFVQAIPTHRCHHIHSFTIGNDTYLAVANYSDGGSYAVDSGIYRWDGSAFVAIQALPTEGAYGFESFTVGSDTYLVYASLYNGFSYETTSRIYRWNGSAFVEVETVATQGAVDWEAFTDAGSTYLAVASYYSSALGTGYIESKVYEFDGTSITAKDSVLTKRARDWQAFTGNGRTYLAVAEFYQDGGAGHLTTSRIFEWTAGGLVERQSFDTFGANDWESFVLGGVHHLALANSRDTDYIADSQIFCPERPEIQAVTDIGNDQGRRVRIAFGRSAFDSPVSASPVLQYEAFRRVDPLPAAAGAYRFTGGETVVPGDVRVDVSRPPLSAAELLDSGWEYVGAVPAHGAAAYSMVAPTLADSSEASGMHWSTFLVRAATAGPLTFFDSAPDSGYSLDNLAPAPPGTLMFAGGVLTWSESADADFDYFTVYGNDGPVLDGTAVVLGATSGTTADVSAQSHPFYLVAATDFSGNEGAAVSTPGQQIGVGDGVVPSAYALHPAAPNPFRSSTIIAFELPEKAPVALDVFDASGRLVRRLSARVRSAGSHRVSWDGLDQAGRPAAAGAYLYRLRAPGYTEANRMILLR